MFNKSDFIMSVFKNGVLLGIVVVLFASCTLNNKRNIRLNTPDACDLEMVEALNQLDGLRAKAIENKRIPRTIGENGEIHWTRNGFDWTEGFFPGSMWMSYNFTKDEKWEKAANQLQNLFVEHRFLTTNHDLGFVFNCSFGNGYKYTSNDKFSSYLIDASNSLITRFNPNVGCIKSWNVDKGWQATRGWKFPVIIDNMMNLEMLFKVSELT